MAEEAHVEALLAGPEVWRKLRDTLGGRRPDLSTVDLRSRDLRRADLGGVDLRQADLSHANLRRAFLRGANSAERNSSVQSWKIRTSPTQT
ncbi:MAG: pentapeptide repeat-containing protein [bacterium]|nr:pentapeptide repeat-containing protein [bacterium]